MQTANAVKVVKKILEEHAISTDNILCDIFLEVNNFGEPKRPSILGMTKNVFAKVDWLENSPSSGIMLQYFLFPIDSIRLFGNCVHCKKLIVHTPQNKMYSLVMAPLDLARSDLEDAWKSWIKAACILHRSERNTSINENKRIKGLFELESDQQNPFIGLSFEKKDVYPFDQNAFQEWLQQPQEPELQNEKKGLLDAFKCWLHCSTKNKSCKTNSKKQAMKTKNNSSNTSEEID
ncbi:hypothetical protein TNCT_65471 [Trichonephila clavata]|uniref:Uncharacterized protein n=1 Tax=Trichonephila clavata TaxID=2740835 RepID=A0A8X6KAZ9_TRICU|nr:hypothetical protein TNCT_65471 [Trichonephila clavata]